MLHGLILVGELALDGLGGRGDSGEVGDLEERGDIGGVASDRIDERCEISTGEISGRPIVRIDALSSSSEISASDDAPSSYELRIEETRAVDVEEKRIVLASELIVDTDINDARPDDIDEARSDSEVVEAARPISSLCFRTMDIGNGCVV